MAEVILYSGSQKTAKTSRAFSCIVKKELMREYTLSFGVVNADPFSQFINENSICEADGQKFDLIGFKRNSGTENITTVDAQHVNYRLLNYSVPVGYSFVGTVAQIAQDILNVSGASAEFSIGTCYDAGAVSFSLGNENVVTAKYALIAMKALGVEVDYDNFTINLPQTVGSGNSETFEFGANMAAVNVTYQKDNGTTYDVDIANLQRIDGNTHVFAVGDTITVVDSLTGKNFSKRIITYEKHLDDPTQDKITLGVFIRDTADDAAAMQATVDNSVQLGEAYNNVSFGRQDGISVQATVAGKDIRVTVNATGGLSITVDGKKTFGVTANGRVFAESISNLDNEDWFAEMGVSDDGTQQGLTLSSPTTPRYLQITESAGNVLIKDRKFHTRQIIGSDGSFNLSDGTHVILNHDANGNFQIYDTTQIRVRVSETVTEIISPDGKNSIYVNNTAAYKNINGAVTQL